MANQYKPQQVGIELVKGCNFSCQMCPVPLYRGEQAWQFMSLDLLDKIVTEIEAHDSVKTIWLVHFGEPLAHPKLEQCLDILARVNKKFTRQVIMHSNASLLKKDKVDALLNNSVVTDLTFSFDGFGDKESFEFLRGPHFDKVINNITRFAQESRSRRPELKLSTCSITPKAEEMPAWDKPIPTHEEILENFKRLFEPVGVTVQHRRMIDFSGNEKLPISGMKPEHIFGGCHFVEKDSLYFTVTGKAQACCNVFNEDFNVGDIQEEDFISLLNNDKMKELRHLLRLDQREKLPFCKNCSQCNGQNLTPSQLQKYWFEKHQQHPLDDAEKRHIFGIFDPSLSNDTESLLEIWRQRQVSRPKTMQRVPPQAIIDRSYFAEQERIVVSGWAADEIDQAPMTEFKAMIDGSPWPIDDIRWSIRSDVAAATGRERWKFSGFELYLSNIIPGRHQVDVEVSNSAGLNTHVSSSVSS